MTLLLRLAAWWLRLVTPYPYSPETSPETVGAHIINPKPPKTPPPAGSAHALPPLERGQPLRNPKPRVPPPDGYQPEGSGSQGSPPQCGSGFDPKRTAGPDSVRLSDRYSFGRTHPEDRSHGDPPSGSSGFVQANFPSQVRVTRVCVHCGKTFREN